MLCFHKFYLDYSACVEDVFLFDVRLCGVCFNASELMFIQDAHVYGRSPDGS